MLCARRGVEKASRPPSPMLQCMKQSWTSRESVIINTYQLREVASTGLEVRVLGCESRTAFFLEQ